MGKTAQGRENIVTFDQILDQVIVLLQQRGKVSYRALKVQFQLDDELLDVLKEELIEVHELAVDKNGKVLVWVGETTVTSSQLSVASPQPPAPSTQPPDALRSTPHAPRTEGDRRQLTVMFCDLVDSTALSTRLDPEELREVVRAYQQTCAEVIARFSGHIAQYLGDGLLVYFGYPVAHEDDAARAVWAGLEIIAAIRGQGSEIGDQEKRPDPSPRLSQPLQVRIGIHTGLVVVGEMGGGERREQLALGDTPNIAARLQGLAAPDTTVISAATHRLVEGLFECHNLGVQTLKGIATPLSVYQVVRESEAQSRFEVAVGTGLIALVGREEELGLLRRRWRQAKDGAGQVVLLNGEAGIGKSRLVQELKAHVTAEEGIRIELRCSPYHQNSALYPVLMHLQRALQFAPQDSPQAKLSKLRQTLTAYRFPEADTLPLLAALLSLPHPESIPPVRLSPQKQKQKIQETLVAWLVEESAKTPVLCTWEDVHWADPSTLDVLTLYLEQIPTIRTLTVLTFRPDFTPPWSPRSYLTQLTLSRLGQRHVEAMITEVTGGKALPSEILSQVVAKTDGVPLFVEELTKTVLESELLTDAKDHYELRGELPPLAIPSTLQDSLMARLDRLAPVREIVQLGATLGREFSYEILRAVSPLAETALQQGLQQLIEAEILYQRGLPPQSTYLFKHTLVQEAAYQSLLKGRRQQLHQQIALVLEERFSDTKETQPELLARHYTEAGLLLRAIPYWQQAGQRAFARSAEREAMAHLQKGLELLNSLPDSPEHDAQELTLLVTLGPALMAIKGYAAAEVAATYARARALSQRVGETPELFPALLGLATYYLMHGEFHAAHELGEQLLHLAHREQDSALFVEAHHILGTTLFHLGDLPAAREHLEQGVARYDLQQHRFLAFRYGHDPGVFCLCYLVRLLWFLGYPEQALQYSRRALALAHEIRHPFSSTLAATFAALVAQLRREEAETITTADAAITLCAEHGFTFYQSMSVILRGWALTARGQSEEGLGQLRQGLVMWQATGAELFRPHLLALLAEAYGETDQVEEGLRVIGEAFDAAHKGGTRFYEAELYRLKGELTLQKPSGVRGPESEVTNPQPPTPNTQAEVEREAEGYFLKAIEIARHQQAKSWELRAATSLARLWQRQGKKTEAHQMLAEIYNWFTEGFDTKDLQEAKALLEKLQH